MIRQYIIFMKRFSSILCRKKWQKLKLRLHVYKILYLIFYFREPKGTFGRTIDAIFSKISLYEGEKLENFIENVSFMIMINLVN